MLELVGIGTQLVDEGLELEVLLGLADEVVGFAEVVGFFEVDAGGHV